MGKMESVDFRPRRQRDDHDVFCSSRNVFAFIDRYLFLFEWHPQLLLEKMM